MTGVDIEKWERDLNALEDRMERWSKIPMKIWPLQFKKYTKMKKTGVRSEDDERCMVVIQKNYKNILRHVSIHFFFHHTVE